MKLDSLSKILIATGQINYMAATIDAVTIPLECMGDDSMIKREMMQGNHDVLKEAVQDLSEIMEKIGNYINNRDIICAIDVRVSKVPFEILISGMDDTNNDYEPVSAESN